MTVRGALPRARLGSATSSLSTHTRPAVRYRQIRSPDTRRAPDCRTGPAVHPAGPVRATALSCRPRSGRAARRAAVPRHSRGQRRFFRTTVAQRQGEQDGHSEQSDPCGHAEQGALWEPEPTCVSHVGLTPGNVSSGRSTTTRGYPTHSRRAPRVLSSMTVHERPTTAGTPTSCASRCLPAGVSRPGFKADGVDQHLIVTRRSRSRRLTKSPQWTRWLVVAGLLPPYATRHHLPASGPALTSADVNRHHASDGDESSGGQGTRHRGNGGERRVSPSRRRRRR